MNIASVTTLLPKLGNSRNHFCCCWGEDLWNDGETNCGASYQIRHSPGQGVVWKPGHYLQHNMHRISQWIPGQYGELAPQLLARLWTELWLTTTTLAGSPSTTFFPYRLWEKIFQWQQRKALFHVHICGPVRKVHRRFFYNIIPKLHAIWLTKFFLAIKLKIM